MARSDPIKYPRRSNPSKYHQELSPAITGLGRLTIVVRLADNPRSVVPTPDPPPEASLRSLACSARHYSEHLHSPSLCKRTDQRTRKLCANGTGSLTQCATTLSSNNGSNLGI